MERQIIIEIGQFLCQIYNVLSWPTFHLFKEAKDFCKNKL